jgi:hypothetical protein
MPPQRATLHTDMQLRRDSVPDCSHIIRSFLAVQPIIGPTAEELSNLDHLFVYQMRMFYEETAMRAFSRLAFLP